MAINYQLIIIIAAIVVGVGAILTQIDIDNTDKGDSLEHSEKFFNFNIETKNAELVELPFNSIFKISGIKDDYIMDGNVQRYLKLFFELDEKKSSQYDVLLNTDEKTIVIFPIFTAAAYNEPGFYNYYKGECDETCLTVPIKAILRTEIGGNGAQILKLLNYNFLSDIDIDKNPDILKDFDKVILLHNEYVTKKQFDAITSHPNVIYLYPNALYAEVKADYEKNTITLIRGHAYPDKTIDNGFNWEFDNTRPYEFDRECDDWEFYEIDNGRMLNCFPEEQLYEDSLLLKTLKEL